MRPQYTPIDQSRFSLVANKYGAPLFTVFAFYLMAFKTMGDHILMLNKINLRD